MSKKLIFLTSFLLMLSLVFANVAFGDVIEVRVAAGEDDAEERVDDGSIDLTSSDLEITEEGDPVDNQLVGMRFNNIAVPQGAIITNAYVQFQVDETDVPGDNRPGTRFLRGEAVDNAATFSDAAFDISSRPTTSAEASWDWPDWLTEDEEGPDQQTSDISAVIQEIVDRPGWSAGNSLVLIITGSGENAAEAFEGEADAAPLLHVEFTSDAPVVGGGSGEILFEYWLDIGGTAVSDLTGAAGYPDSPDDSELRNAFEGMVDWADNYGIRARGFLYPPADGDYTLWISGDDFIELYLSTDDDPANAALIAEVPGWTSYLEWSKYPEQQSAPIPLVAGQKYYIEALMKEGGGGDSLTAGWTGPAIGEEIAIIDGTFLSPVVRIAAWAADPISGAVDVKGAPVLTWMAGETAFQHDLYLGTDADLVAAGDASVLQGSLAEASFEVDVNTPLERGTTYYWKVDVTTGSSRASELHPGNVWSFRVADLNTESWLAAATADSPAYLDTFVADGLYDIGALSGDITYEFVVLSNPDEAEASMCLIGRRQFGDTQAGLKFDQWNDTGEYGATVFGVVDLYYGIPNNSGEYTHLAFVSSEDTATTALYVNGALAGSVDSAITLSGIVGIGYGAEGEDMSGSFDNFDGTIFGVAIYDEALSDELIAAHADSYFNPVTEIVPVDPGTEGLVAYYAFENDVNDNSGNGNVGTIVGDPVFVEGPAGFGTAMEFNGDDYVDCGNADSLQIQDAITMSFWFNVVAFENTWEAMLSKGDSAYRVSRGGGDGDATHMGISGTTGGGGNGWFNGVTLVTGGVWHHFAGTYDGAEGRIYIDGVLDATTEATGQINIETENLWIGNNSQNVDRLFHGIMDEVMIYNRALSDLEVMYLAGKRATPVDPGTDGLLAFWTCDEGEGAVVGDASGNGRDGAIVNGDPVWVEGVNGTAVELVGPTLVEVPPLAMELTGATMAGWIKPNGVSPDWSAVIMHRGTGLAHGFNMLVDFQLAYHWNDDSGSWSFRGGDFIAEDDWTFAAVTVDAEKATFYVNGEMGSVNEITHEPAMWDGNIYLGGDGGDDWIARRMNGALDDVIMYDRALSASEIRYLAGARAMDDVLGPDVTGLGDVVQGVPNDGETTGGGDNGWPGAETPDLAFDDDVTTKYLHFKGEAEPTGLRIEPASGASIVTGLTFTTANDAIERDPISFELSGSNDSIDGPYELIASGDIVDFAQDEAWPRFTMNATPITFGNNVAYKYYQVMFPVVRDAASANSMQIAEVELRTSKF